ncbi:MAG: DUF3575 domain-containing protein [Duncaniella sp.]|nr:DUF3575 domain-containing protein [Duncaniella sp.]
MNIPNTLRQLTVLFMLLILASPVSAQEESDSVFTFRFFPGKNEFYAPGLNNGAELARLFECVDRYKNLIKDHKIMLYVNGYSNAKVSDAKNLRIARTRSLRVKSELITLRGLTENCFITRNHVGEGDFVTVRFFVPKDSIVPAAPAEAVDEVFPPAKEPEEVKQEDSDADSHSEVSVPEQPEAVTPMAEPVENITYIRKDSRFALKTNLLDYAILMPNIELEWMFVDRWSVALEAQGAWYSKSSPRKVYRVATLIPEFRYWVIDRARWHGMYVGVFGGVGMYDLSNSTKGHEGEGGMAGLSVGYMWPIGKHFSLDAGIGVGYMRLRDKVYTPADGHFLYQYTKNIDYVGPLRLKLSLVWRIQGKKIKSVK